MYSLMIVYTTKSNIFPTILSPITFTKVYDSWCQTHDVLKGSWYSLFLLIPMTQFIVDCYQYSTYTVDIFPANF